MSDKVLLELPDEIAQGAKQSEFSSETVLPAEFDRAAEYPVFTPYGNEAAAEALLLHLNKAQK